jgi:hypothetical protein
MNRYVVKEAFAYRGLVLEFVVLLCVLFVSSRLIITTPPLPHASVFEKSGANEGAHIVLTENVADSEQFLVTIHDAIKTNNLMVVLINEARGLGPNVVQAGRIGENSFVFPKSVLAPPGLWRLDLTAQRERGYDANVGFVIDYPRELENVSTHSEERSFDLFAVFSLLTGVGALVLGGGLYFHALREVSQVG